MCVVVCVVVVDIVLVVVTECVAIALHRLAAPLATMLQVAHQRLWPVLQLRLVLVVAHQPFVAQTAVAQPPAVEVAAVVDAVDAAVVAAVAVAAVVATVAAVVPEAVAAVAAVASAAAVAVAAANDERMMTTIRAMIVCLSIE